jgi:uncharacterized protein YaaR (DUF327 family)
MPGFFSAKAANTLTSWSNYYIDWSRVGELLKQGTHRYTVNELIQRGIILAGTGAGAYLGYTYTNQQNSNIMSGLYSMSGCFVGFVVSHLAVISPLIYKRYQTSQDCAKAQKEILNSLQDLKASSPNNETINHLIHIISTHVETIMTMNFSTEKRANASLTWGKRRTYLTHLEDKLQQDVAELNKGSIDLLDEIEQFWSQETSALIDNLKNYSPKKESTSDESFFETLQIR